MTAHSGARNTRLALLVIAAAQLLMVMDGTIVTVGLPVIGAGLGIAEADLDWVLTAYALAFGGLLLAGGRAGDLFGRRRLFRTGLTVFLAASLLGGVAGNGAVLIAARVLQGVGAAIVAPAALSLLADTFPAGPERNKALGLYGAMGGLGAVVGLLLGGALTEYLGWRWILFINVPIALLLLAGTTALVPGTRERGAIDLPGAATATLALGSLVYAINRAGSVGVGDGTTLAFGAVAVALLALFLFIQRTARSPMLPLRVLADRGRLGANLVMLLMGAGQLATFYFLTLHMQAIEQYSPMITGLAYLPFAIGIGLGSGLIGPRLHARTSTCVALVTGMLTAAAAMGWFSLLSPDQNPLLVLLPAQLAGGIGLGIGFVAVTIRGVQGIAPSDSGIASGLVNTSQQIGGAMGLAVLAGVAVATTATQPQGTAIREALTSGYTAGLLGAGGFYLTAALTAVLLVRGHPASPDSKPVRKPSTARPGEPVTFAPNDPSEQCTARKSEGKSIMTTIESRLPNPAVLVPELKTIGGALFAATGNGTIPPSTISLVQLRAGQIVGSTYLTVLHTGNLRKAGVSDENITAVASWRDAPYFTAAERIALELVEAVLTPSPSGERVPDELYARASEQYDDKALATLIMAIGQVCFFLPLALIGKPLPGTSPAEQWRH